MKRCDCHKGTILCGPKVKHAPAGRMKPTKVSKITARAETRAQCETRADGRCEVAAFGACSGNLEHDHFFGRGKVPADMRLEWMLCQEHHHRKTESRPSRLWWLRIFGVHASFHGYEDALRRVEAAEALEEAQHPEAQRAPAARRAT